MMKTNKKTIPFSKNFILLALLSILFSCSNIDQMEDCLKGTLKLNIIMPSGVKSEPISGNEITINIYKNKDRVLSYDGIENIPAEIDLPEGSYYVQAITTEIPAAAFEMPCYSGKSENFSIFAEKESEISITCSICNIPVSITYSDSTKYYFNTYTTEVSNSSSSLTYSGENKDKCGYFDKGPLTITSLLTYTTSDEESKTKTLTGEIKTPLAGKNYTIKIDTKSPGDISVTISFDDSIEDLNFILTDDGFIEQSKYSEGDFLITEIMCNPEKIGDTKGEWVEIYNNTTNEQNFKGFVLKKSSTDFIQITDDLIIPSMGYAVLANSSEAGSNDEVDYVYGTGFSLTNTDLNLNLTTGGTDGTDGFSIFSINMGQDEFPSIVSGKSVQLNLTNINTINTIEATEAQKGKNWSNSTETFSTGDYGTPGEANTVVE